MGPLRDEGWLRTGGWWELRYRDHGWDGIPVVPGRVLGTSGPNMWAWDRERDGGMRGKHLSAITKEDQSHSFSTVCWETPGSWCKQYLMVKTSQPPPPPSLSPPGFNKTSRAQLTQASQLMREGGGAPCGTHSAKGSSGRRILRAGFTLPNKTHTHTHVRTHTHTHTHSGEVAGEEDGGNLIYKSDTCPNNWVSTDLCLCY